jgi:hypothetical protein
MSRTKRALMITDSNQAYFAKMSACGLQEGVFTPMTTSKVTFWFEV